MARCRPIIWNIPTRQGRPPWRNPGRLRESGGTRAAPQHREDPLLLLRSQEEAVADAEATRREVARPRAGAIRDDAAEIGPGGHFFKEVGAGIFGTGVQQLVGTFTAWEHRYLELDYIDGVTLKDNISQLTHIVGGICGAVLGIAMRK